MKSVTTWYNRKTTRIFSHACFLVLTYLVALQLFKSDTEITMVDHIYTGLFLSTLLPLVYLNLEWLLPRVHSRKHITWYIPLVIVLVIVFSWLNIRLFDKWTAALLPQFYFVSYYSWLEVGAMFTGFIAITSLVKLSRSWFLLQDLQQKMLVLDKEKVDMELSALKAQVNPHFFFNTLNSIYALSLDKDDRLPATVLQLAAIMRYYLYESGGETVPIEKEIAILRDYIQLQQMRSGKLLDISLEADVEPGEKYIAPLLLITLVENAFKHGAKGVVGTSFIHMKIRTSGSDFLFHIVNNKGQSDEPLHPGKGLGLENLKRRLELLYHNRHQLEISETADDFTVLLKINL